MKYIKLFQTEAEKNAATLDLPNLNYVIENDEIEILPAEQPETDVVCIYTIDSIEQIHICNNTDSFSGTMEVDGIEVELATDYTFSTTGEHTVKFKPNGTNIGNETFQDCSRLISVTIPNSITSLGEFFFAYCDSLSSITCYATTAPSTENNTFYRMGEGGVLYYPSGSDYSTWMDNDHLGYYNWTSQEI